MAYRCVYSGGSNTGGTCGSPPSANDWANTSYNTLVGALAVSSAGDTIYVHDAHVWAYGSAQTLTGPASGTVYVYSLDHTDVTSTTLKYGAKEYTNGNFGLTLNGGFFIHGMDLEAGTGSAQNSAGISFGNASSNDCVIKLVGCLVRQNTTGNPSITYAPSRAYQQGLYAENTTFQFGAASQYLNIQGANMQLDNCTFSGSVTTLLKPNTQHGSLNARGCDMSNATNLIDVGADDTESYIELHNCKVPSNITTGTHNGVGSHVIEAMACTTGDHTYNYYRMDASGIVQDNETYYLTGGAQIKDQDGTLVGYSLAMAPNATYCSTQFPLYSPWQTVNVPATGSKTFTMHVTYDSATAAKDCELFLELEYYGDSTSPLSTVKSSAPLVSGTNNRDILAAGSNLGADSGSSWTGTGGFTNPQKHALAITATVNQIGMARCRVGYTKASGATVYVDNQITVS